MKDSTEMSELENIYNKHYILDFHSGQNIMSFDQFKQALTEVLKLVEVTDEEISVAQDIYYRLGAKWSRDLSKTKLEQLLNNSPK